MPVKISKTFKLYFRAYAVFFDYTQYSQLSTIQKTKNTAKSDGVFSVDRGGVEPLERVDKTAPETLRTRPSNPRTYRISIQIKRKAPFIGALRSRERFRSQRPCQPCFHYITSNNHVKRLIHN